MNSMQVGDPSSKVGKVVVTGDVFASKLEALGDNIAPILASDDSSVQFQSCCKAQPTSIQNLTQSAKSRIGGAFDLAGS